MKEVETMKDQLLSLKHFTEVFNKKISSNTVQKTKTEADQLLNFST